MTEHPLSDQQHQAQYSAAIQQAYTQGDAAFQNWFNRAGNVEEAIVRGFWDFSCHILTDKVTAAMTAPETRTTLEIGYGGGQNYVTLRK